MIWPLNKIFKKKKTEEIPSVKITSPLPFYSGAALASLNSLPIQWRNPAAQSQFNTQQNLTAIQSQLAAQQNALSHHQQHLAYHQNAFQGFNSWIIPPIQLTKKEWKSEKRKEIHNSKQWINSWKQNIKDQERLIKETEILLEIVGDDKC